MARHDAAGAQDAAGWRGMTSETRQTQKGQRRGPAAWLLMKLIRLYQLTLSAFIGRSCRHLPTCSDYAMQAIARHGAWAGFWLGFFRVLRCHPWGTHGLDPVPEKNVPRHDPRFWRYRLYGSCAFPGMDAGEKERHGTKE